MLSVKGTAPKKPARHPGKRKRGQKSSYPGLMPPAGKSEIGGRE